LKGFKLEIALNGVTIGKFDATRFSPILQGNVSPSAMMTSLHKCNIIERVPNKNKVRKVAIQAYFADCRKMHIEMKSFSSNFPDRLWSKL